MAATLQFNSCVISDFNAPPLRTVVTFQAPIFYPIFFPLKPLGIYLRVRGFSSGFQTIHTLRNRVSALRLISGNAGGPDGCVFSSISCISALIYPNIILTSLLPSILLHLFPFFLSLFFQYLFVSLFPLSIHSFLIPYFPVLFLSNFNLFPSFIFLSSFLPSFLFCFLKPYPVNVVNMVSFEKCPQMADGI